MNMSLVDAYICPPCKDGNHILCTNEISESQGAQHGYIHKTDNGSTVFAFSNGCACNHGAIREEIKKEKLEIERLNDERRLRQF